MESVASSYNSSSYSNLSFSNLSTFYPGDIVNGTHLATVAASLQSSSSLCLNFSFYLNTVLIGVLCLLGLAGNTLSILVLQRDKHNEVAAFLLQTLAVADNALLLVSLVVLSVFVGIGPLPSARTVVLPAVPYLKKYVNPIGYVTKCMTVWTTVLLAINRFLAVCKPFAFDRILTVRRAKIQVTVIAVLSILLNVPRLFQYDVVYRTNSRNETVAVSVVTEFGQNKVIEMVYFNIIYTTVILGAPILLLVCFNTLLVRRLRVSMRNMRRNSIAYLGSQEKNITIVMIIIIVEFLVCHTPDRVINILKYASEGHSGSWTCPHPLFYAASISNVLIVFNASTNFVVYLAFRERFRRILREQVCSSESSCCCCCWCWWWWWLCKVIPVDADGLYVGHHRSESSEMGLMKQRLNGGIERKISIGSCPMRIASPSGNGFVLETTEIRRK